MWIQVNLVDGVEQTNQVKKCFPVLFFRYTTLICHWGREDNIFFIDEDNTLFDQTFIGILQLLSV